MSDRYPRLFSPLKIGARTARNRVLLSGHSKLYSYRGLTSPRELNYVKARARGGAAVIITGLRPVHPSTVNLRGASIGYLAGGIHADRAMAAAAQTEGALLFAQIGHLGAFPPSDWTDDPRVAIGASAVRSSFSGEVAKAAELDDIDEIVDYWCKSAQIAKAAQFDGIELHFAHGYFVQQFLSPVYNKRNDHYGGSPENRSRLLRRIVEDVRAAVGRDIVLGARIPVGDLASFDGALEIGDMISLAQALEDSELLDYLSVSVGGLKKAFEVSPSDIPDAHLVDLVGRVKGATLGIPVFAVGGIRFPWQAEEIVASGKADMVALTRAQIADPEFANKAREGREDEIYHCIRGNQGCMARGFRGLPIGCTVNPVTGREGRFGVLVGASSRRRWLVVGGGPAGMKAAETLAKRGHQVVLAERESRLGGQVNLILRTPGRETFAVLVEDLETHMRLHGVEIRLGVEVTAASVAGFAADAVLVATGAVPSRTGFSSFAPLVERLPGVEGEQVLTVWDVLLETRPVGERVVVLDDDGSRYAAGTVEVLLDRGSRVELVTPFNAMFPFTAVTADMPLLYERLLKKGLTARVNSWVSRLESDAAIAFNMYTGEEAVLAADTVVLAMAPTANDALYFALKSGTVADVHRIGDCVSPRKLDHAIYEGYVAGRELWDPEERYINEGELENWDTETTGSPMAASNVIVASR